MYTKHICVSANESIAEFSPENGELTKVLGEFADVCAADGRNAVYVGRKNGKKLFIAGDYCGFACFSDGTLVEILPQSTGGAAEARKTLCTEFCKHCGYNFDQLNFDPEMNFLEYFISVFASETVKIIKSGVLSAYASREDNLTSVQGTIMFAENIRRNLVHRERVYVRHDVFTPDRAENRIIKAAAVILNKLTASSHNSHLLKEALSYFDDVPVPINITAEFGKCINTRNTKKYSTILSICRMLFDKNEGTAFTGKYVSCAQFYKFEPQK
jgi:5-methylcytosine-specific restriction endonuclease McrBC regulatory subunit McrC